MSREKLAIDGGTPVRTTPLPNPYLGASVLGEEELSLLNEVIRNKAPFRAYGANPPHMVNDFEAEARQYFGVRHALATATGSGSFYCAMAGLGIGPGDEVLIPSFSWHTDFEAPVLLGATPVFVDIDRSLNMDPDDLAKKITPRTKAVIVVHFQGAAADMDRILALARSRQIMVVEDCAQAFGAEYKGRKVGSLGDVACFSFQQNKVLVTGEGGLLLSNSPLVFERAARYHDLSFLRPALAAQLSEGPKEQPFCGLQFRMNEFTGAVALAQIRKIDRAVISITRAYHKKLLSLISDQCPGLVMRRSADPDGAAGIAFYMDLGTPVRGRWLKKALAAEGIRVGPSSSCKNLLQDAFITSKRLAHPALPPFGADWPGEHVVYSPESCPNTDDILESLVCVAMSPNYTEQDIEDIARAIIKVWPMIPETEKELVS